MERIMKYINRVYRASVLDRASSFKDENLKGHQLSYILQVCRNPGLNQDELAARLFVNKSSVTRQLCQLEDADFIYRVEAEDDRRIRRIYPTQKSIKLYPEIMKYLEFWNDTLTGALSSSDQHTLLRLLRYLASAASKGVNHHAPNGENLKSEE